MSWGVRFVRFNERSKGRRHGWAGPLLKAGSTTWRPAKVTDTRDKQSPQKGPQTRGGPSEGGASLTSGGSAAGGLLMSQSPSPDGEERPVGRWRKWL